MNMVSTSSAKVSNEAERSRITRGIAELNVQGEAPHQPTHIFDLVQNYDLFLFDFDGTLVNTDHIYYEAFQYAFREKGIHFAVPFSEFTILLNSKRVPRSLWHELQLRYCLSNAQVEELRELRSDYYWKCVKRGDVKLKEGVEDLLNALKRADKACCVCTKSSTKETSVIRRYIPLLADIPGERWYTRDTQTLQKPNPQCYLMAISDYMNHRDAEEEVSSENNDTNEDQNDIRIIGFEDSPSGLTALLSADVVRPVYIGSVRYPELDYFIDNGVTWCKSFSDVLLAGPQA